MSGRNRLGSTKVSTRSDAAASAALRDTHLRIPRWADRGGPEGPEGHEHRRGDKQDPESWGRPGVVLPHPRDLRADAVRRRVSRPRRHHFLGRKTATTLGRITSRSGARRPNVLAAPASRSPPRWKTPTQVSGPLLAAGAARGSATPASTSPSARDSISARVTSQGGPSSAAAPSASTNWTESRSPPGASSDRMPATASSRSGRGRACTVKTSTTRSNAATRSSGQVEQVGDPVVDGRSPGTGTARARPRTGPGRRRRCGTRARRAARHPHRGRRRRRPRGARPRHRRGRRGRAPAGRARCGPRACRPRRARRPTTAPRTSGWALRRPPASPASRLASTSQSRESASPHVAGSRHAQRRSSRTITSVCGVCGNMSNTRPATGCSDGMAARSRASESTLQLE